MIRPGPGVAFTWVGEGDMRGDPAAHGRVSRQLGVGDAWATVEQVHGAEVATPTEPGAHGPADAVVVTRTGLPAAVFTADCLGVVLRGERGAGVAHAGWRGLAAGVIEATRSALERAGAPPTHAYIGPGIGPCCFEVGPEVAERFGPDVRRTTWGTPSVDLAGAAARRLTDLEVWEDGRCTMCEGGLSHRRTGDPARMAAIGWVT